MTTFEQRISLSAAPVRSAARRATKLLLTTLVGASRLLSGSCLRGTQPVIAVIGKPRAYADVEALRSHVTILSRTLHPRSAAHSENLQRVAAYIKTQFSKASTRVSLQTFVVEGYPVHNVIARFGPATGRTIVIGAHFDSAHLTPGADDNASGVAGLTRSLKTAMASAVDLPVRSINSPRAWLPIDLSDHLNYWDAGFDAVMITDTAYYRNRNYHQATNMPDTLDYKRMAMVVDALLRPLPTRIRVSETTP